MIETKNKVICEKNAEIYGIRNGDWVNVAVFDLVKKDMKAQGVPDIDYTDRAVFRDGVMVTTMLSKEPEKEYEIDDIDPDVVNWAKEITARLMGDE